MVRDRSPSAPRFPRDFEPQRPRDVSAAITIVALIVILAAWKLVELIAALAHLATGG
jgi:hypothetical protein